MQHYCLSANLVQFLLNTNFFSVYECSLFYLLLFMSFDVYI